MKRVIEESSWSQGVVDCVIHPIKDVEGPVQPPRGQSNLLVHHLSMVVWLFLTQRDLRCGLDAEHSSQVPHSCSLRYLTGATYL